MDEHIASCRKLAKKMCFNLAYTLKKVKIVGKKFSDGEGDYDDEKGGLLSEEVERWKSQHQQQQTDKAKGSHSHGDDR